VRSEPTKSYFDEIATGWEKLREGFFSDRIREKAIFAASVGAGRVAADIGAGTGFIAEGLVRRGVKVIAVDESEKMLDELSRRLPIGSVDCRLGSAERIPIEDEAVDYVFANMLLHHVEEPSRAIREMARVLRPGGVVLITDLDRHEFEFLKTEQHDRWKGFERESLSGWLQGAGLTNVAVESLGEDCCAKSSKGEEEATVSIFIASGRKGNERFKK